MNDSSKQSRASADASQPLVSVIIPVFNRRQMIGRAIESALDQTWSRIEVIAIDDGSTDGSADAAEEYGPPVRVIRTENRGPYHARNEGVRQSTGEFLAFLDSDDRWLPHHIEKQMALFEDPAVGLTFGDAIYVRQESGVRLSRTLFQSQTIPYRGAVFERLSFGNFVANSSVIVRREAFLASGLFEFEDRLLSADYLHWFRLSQKCRFDFVDEPVFEYSLHSGNISGNLQRSLEDRQLLFRKELARVSDPNTRRALQHLLFNLRVHYRIWAIRNQGSEAVIDFQKKVLGDDPLRTIDRLTRIRWYVLWLHNQIKLRARRLLPPPIRGAALQ